MRASRRAPWPAPRRRCRTRSRPPCRRRPRSAPARSSRRSLRRAPERDRGALGDHRQRGRLADARRGAGDQRLAALERSGHRRQTLFRVAALRPRRRRLGRGVGRDRPRPRGPPRPRARSTAPARRRAPRPRGCRWRRPGRWRGARAARSITVTSPSASSPSVTAETVYWRSSHSISVAFWIAPKIASTGPSPPDSPTDLRAGGHRHARPGRSGSRRVEASTSNQASS